MSKISRPRLSLWLDYLLVGTLLLAMMGFERLRGHEETKQQELNRLQTLTRVVDASLTCLAIIGPSET